MEKKEIKQIVKESIERFEFLKKEFEIFGYYDECKVCGINPEKMIKLFKSIDKLIK